MTNKRLKNKKLNKMYQLISYDAEKRIEYLQSLNVFDQAEILLRVSKHVQFEIIKHISDTEIVEILENLAPDDATDILQLLPDSRQSHIIRLLSEHLRSAVAMLLHFDANTAAGLMNLDYIIVSPTDTIAKVSKQVQVHETRTGKLPTILVVSDGKLSGQLPGHALGFARASDVVKKYRKKILTVSYNAHYEEVLERFRTHPHNKLVVTGESDQILGVIYTDDILKLIKEHEASSLYDFAGVSDEESIFDTVGRKVHSRYKWLIINLATSFLAAFVVSFFDEVIAKNVLLAVYMPIVAGMGGNASTQTLAVMVRGLSQQTLEKDSIKSALKNELLSGLFNGILNGAIVTSIVWLVNRDLLVGIVLGLAMVVNLLVAAFFGTIVPVVMKRLGKDPATSATIFITTATDVFGFLAFLGFASFIL